MAGFFLIWLSLSASAALPPAGTTATMGQLRSALDRSGVDADWASFTATPVGPVARRPSWLVVEGDGPDFVSAEKTLMSAMEILGRTPTGAGFARLLAQDGGRVILRENGSLMVIDGENAVIAGPDFVNEKHDWEFAVQMAHELEHLEQRRLGITGQSARGARELGAFLVQARVWIESGGRIDGEHWKTNMANSQDMAAWLENPWAAMTAMALRAELELDLSRPEVKAYFQGVLKDEAAWRKLNAKKFPQVDSAGASRFVLNQALRFSDENPGGELSPWILQAIERAALLPPGEAFELPGEPTAKDRVVLGALPGAAHLKGRRLKAPHLAEPD